MNKTLISLLAAAVLATPLAFAEGKNKQGGEHRGKQRAAHMQEHFGVSDDQLSQMREIRDNGGSREDVRAVLSDDQRSQMEQWRKDNPRSGKGSHHQRQGNGEQGE
ncbi:MAG: hypothetical protein ABJK20_09530 [Halieaceae bacterium]